MLFRFSLDIDAVIAEIDANPRLADIWLMDLWEFWQNHGILCGGGTDDFSEKAYRLSVSSLSHRTPVKALVNALIDSNVELNRRVTETEDIDFGNIKSCIDITKFGTQSSLTLVGNAQIDLMKNEDEDEDERFCIHCSDNEVVPWQHALNACLLEDSPKTFPIPLNWKGRQIYKTRLEPYIPYVDDISLVDYQVLQDHHLPALSKFIKWTSEAASDRYRPHVKVYTQVDNVDVWTRVKIKQAFKDHDISKGNLSGLTVYVFDSGNFRGTDRRFSIERWVRLGEAIFFKFHGLRILDKKITAGEECSLVEPNLAYELQREEDILSKDRNKTPIEID